MKAFLGGLIIGGAAVALAYSYLPEPPVPATSPSATEASGLESHPSDRWEGIWPNTLRNVLFSKDTGEQAPDLKDANDYPFIKFSAVQPYLSFTRADIQSVCISPVGAPSDYTSVSTDIYLTVDARHKLASALEARDGEKTAIRIMGLDINNFTVDAEKVATFKAHAGYYREEANTPSVDGATAPDMEFDWPDITFVSYGSDVSMGLTMTKYLTGTNTLRSCDPALDVNTFPGYRHHYDMWKDQLDD